MAFPKTPSWYVVVDTKHSKKTVQFLILIYLILDFKLIILLDPVEGSSVEEHGEDDDNDDEEE